MNFRHLLGCDTIEITEVSGLQMPIFEWVDSSSSGQRNNYSLWLRTYHPV